MGAFPQSSCDPSTRTRAPALAPTRLRERGSPGRGDSRTLPARPWRDAGHELRQLIDACADVAKCSRVRLEFHEHGERADRLVHPRKRIPKIVQDAERVLGGPTGCRCRAFEPFDAILQTTLGDRQAPEL